MLKQRARFVAGGLRVFDLAMLAAAFPVAYELRNRVMGETALGLFPMASYLPLLVTSLVGWVGAAWLAKLYGAYRTKGIAVEIARLGQSFLILAVVMAAVQFVQKQHELSRTFFAAYYLVGFLFLVGNRLTLRVVAHEVRRRGYNTRTFAVAGCGEMVEDIVASIASHKEWGYVFAGYILEDGAEAPSGARVLGRLSEMPRILEEHVLDDVIFGVPRERLEVIEEATQLCEEQGVRVKLLLNFFPARIGKMAVEEVDGIAMLALTTTPSDMLPLVLKRLFDIAVSAFILVLLSPLLLAVAIAIKLESPGPIFFRQRRVSLNGREFWLLKFRSMCVDAEEKLAALRRHNEMGGPVFKMARDPRVTRVGRFIRRASIDEFPQFWNVLRGEMSIVGPRPPLPSEVKLYKPWERRRLSVKPGITCTWQISGRNEIDFAHWMKLDLHYIDNWSLGYDMKIVLQTIPAVLLGRGAR